MEALGSGDLLTSLRRETPETYAQAIQQAHKHAETEEPFRQKWKREAKRLREEDVKAIRRPITCVKSLVNC